MNDEDKKHHEATYYRYCRDVNGNLVPVDLVRQNGRLVPRFPPDIAEPLFPWADSESRDYAELVEELCQCLNYLERRRWLLAIQGERSISEIAVLEAVSRQAIIDSFHRMARKNPYVAIWLRNKPSTNQHR